MLAKKLYRHLEIIQGIRPVPAHDCRDGVLASGLDRARSSDSYVSLELAPALWEQADQTCAGRRSAARVSAGAPVLRQAGADPLAKHVTLELRDAGEHRRHHPPVRRIDLEGHAAHRDDRHAPARQPVKRIERILGRTPPAAEFDNEDRNGYSTTFSTSNFCESGTGPHTERLPRHRKNMSAIELRIPLGEARPVFLTWRTFNP